MTKTLLDTDIFSEISKGIDQTVARNATAYRNAFGHYTLSAVTVMEVVLGFEKNQSVRRLQVLWRRNFDPPSLEMTRPSRRLLLTRPNKREPMTSDSQPKSVNRTVTSACKLSLIVAALASSATMVFAVGGDRGIPVGWTTAEPRKELRPKFSYDAHGGRDGRGAFVIAADQRDGLDGWWTTTVPVKGGSHYRFHAARKTDGVALTRQCAVVRIVWQDDSGRSVSLDVPAVTGYLKGWKPTAEPEFPTDKPTDGKGWTEVSDTYRVPSKATRAVIELHLQWPPPGGRIEWSEVSFEETSPTAGRRVRLAAAHFRPSGKSAATNRAEAAPLIAQAAKQKADMIVLGETLPYYGLGKTPVESSEPVPGPTTEYFGALAKQHNLYIVLSVFERDGHLVYNTAVLLGPDGTLVGKYRKVCLPRGEVASGIAPGHEYPVFDTRFGKLGMMVCYDGFFPEVARELTNRGAEVIAWPVWGCNPLLASARACENHVYVVSSTYEDISRNWMLTAIYGHDGQPIVHAETWGTIILSEVDLDQRVQWNSLGDFKAELPRHRPSGNSDRPRD